MSRLPHRVVAERALGKPLPPGSSVHHVDENRQNNQNSNLVICQDEAYHKLLHVRMRVLAAGGDPNTQRICHMCKGLKVADELVGNPFTTYNLVRCHPCNRAHVARYQ